MGHKVTNAESHLRTQETYGLLSTGHSRTQIIQICSGKWQVSERQVDNYIKKARDLLMADADMARPAWLAEALQRLRTYENAAYKRGQIQVALNSVAAQARLIGMEV